MKTLIQRFEDKYIPEPNSGCWIWIGVLSGKYGQILCDGKMQYAHRVSFELFKNKIPDGMEIDHLCRVRCCVNPNHLEPVTCKENIRRGLLGSVMKTHCPKGHPYSEDNLYVRPDGGRGCRICIRLACRKWYPKRIRTHFKTFNAN